jgi:hypothetical protein
VLEKQAAALAQEKDSASLFQITNRQAAAAMASSNEGEPLAVCVCKGEEHEPSAAPQGVTACQMCSGIS